jgi:hypothetical protein
MEWINKISRIVVLNLTKRDDRLLEFGSMAEKYSIPYERVSAIEKPNGAEGLRDTVVKLFMEEIRKGTQHLLVFEDDAEIVSDPDTFHEYMNKVVDQLPENYHLCFLGCQLTSNGCKFYTSNLINVQKAFSTHAVIWSLQGMKECISLGMGYPIDNWMVENIEPMSHSYCTYPFLVSQRDGVSDIGGQWISWKPFLDGRFNQQVANIKK